MWEKLRVLVPGVLTLGLCFTVSGAGAAADSILEDSPAQEIRDASAEGVAVLFLGREIIYDVGKGFCPNGYKEGNFDGDGDASDCRIKYFVAETFPSRASAKRI